MIAEYRELFGELKYFHLGGDEAYSFGSCPECSARERMELYNEHINELAAPLFADGIRAGIWADMILAMPERLGAISHEFVIWDWNYFDGLDTPAQVHIWGGNRLKPSEVTSEHKRLFPGIVDEDGNPRTFYTARMLKERGYDVVLCSAMKAYADGFLTPNLAVHAPNVAVLQIEYMNLLKMVFNEGGVALIPEVESFKKNLAELYEMEQTWESAWHNAGLVVDPLVEYLEGV